MCSVPPRANREQKKYPSAGNSQVVTNNSLNRVKLQLSYSAYSVNLLSGTTAQLPRRPHPYRAPLYPPPYL
jgi:hypothetical protein